MLSGHVLELVATGIFYGFLNINYKIWANFKGLKSHLIHDFKQKKTFHIKKISKPSKYAFKTLGNICQ